MIPFFSDLDNTLVYSHRVPLPGERVAVEHLNNRIQSYMTKRTFDFLTSCRDIWLIPTTMRTTEQYSRLSDTFARFGCRYALVCNGGILLDHGREDHHWMAESRWMTQNDRSDLLEAETWLRCCCLGESIHVVEGILVYSRAENPAQTASRLSDALRGTALNVYYDSRKVYCLPSAMNKGTALKRFALREKITWSAAAGDGAADIPMLETANLAIMPANLADTVSNPCRCVSDDRRCFSDFICRELADLLDPGRAESPADSRMARQ